jgi:hypothetical protein
MPLLIYLIKNKLQNDICFNAKIQYEVLDFIDIINFLLQLNKKLKRTLSMVIRCKSSEEMLLIKVKTINDSVKQNLVKNQ